MQEWTIYEITTEKSIIHGIMLRGRIRKFALENNVNLLAENATDIENGVRFALYIDQKPDLVIKFIKNIIPDSIINVVIDEVKNPVLSKLKVNNEDRYTI
ncbi:MAG: hypothetical protein MRY57_03665 [Candidatus Pacebacteria bacterium]|nr:hypothetical protein [Candidatus Paceibacterota bacterium]